jgi:hypothetical protein
MEETPELDYCYVWGNCIFKALVALKKDVSSQLEFGNHQNLSSWGRLEHEQ